MADFSLQIGRSSNWPPMGLHFRWKPILLPIFILFGWWLAASAQVASSKLLVAPQDVITVAFVDPVGRRVWLDTAQSLARMLVGFTIGGSLGLAVGVSLGLARLADRALSPTLNALRQITLFAWMPLLTGWFGNGESTRVLYIALSAFFPIAFSVQEGLKRIPSRYLEVADVLRLGRYRRLAVVLLPAAMPSICIGLQIGMLTAWLGTISAEYVIGVSSGLGSLIVFGREQFRMEIVLLGVLVLSLVAYVMGTLSAMGRSYLLRNHGVAK